jgi:hypothetical protein
MSVVLLIFKKDVKSRKIPLKKAKEWVALAHRVLRENHTALVVLNGIVHAIK